MTSGNTRNRNWRHGEKRKEMETLPTQLAGAIPTARSSSVPGFIGTSTAMLNIYDKILNAAETTATVFLTGESGTGKNLCARAIHHYGPRCATPFVSFDCTGALHDLFAPGGATDDAQGGTLFLDNICDMDDDMQKKFLHFLLKEKERQAGVGGAGRDTGIRLICATHRDPLQEVGAGRFREELFYRLYVIPIHMPPLRQRGDDIVDIAQIFVLRYAAEEGKSFRGLTADAEDVLRNYGWPGNIRQLQNTIRNAVIMHDGIALTAKMLALLPLPDQQESRPIPVWRKPASGAAPVQPLDQVERVAIERAIRICDGNIQQAASLLQVSPSTLYRKKSAWEGPGQGQNSH